MCSNEQLRLNKALFDAVRMEDFENAERLLKLGADPLGAIAEADLDENLLGELFFAMIDDVDWALSLPDFLQLFYAYGMDIAAKRFPTDDDNYIHPLSQLSYCKNENGLRVLHTMLEHGLDCASAEVLVDHILTDMEMCDGSEIEPAWRINGIIYGLKMVMLVASYPYILEQSAYIRACIETKRNDVRNLSRFRDWNRFDYQIDLSTCTNIPYGLRNATLRIQDKDTGEHIWTLSV